MTRLPRHVERRRSSPRPPVKADGGCVIVIDDDPWEIGFEVFVDPSLPDERTYARKVATIEAARAYADLLVSLLGLGVLDRTAGAS